MSIASPADQLLGMKLKNGWNVIEKVLQAPGSTGGFFSKGYIVENDRQRAFLKAIDYSKLFQDPNSAERMHEMLAAYLFEKNLLNQCGEKRLSHVVQVLDDGQCTVSSAPTVPVPYLIFELAHGDVRGYMDKMMQFDYAWILRSLHNASLGLMQLHKQDVAHQDLKPSNILVFEENLSKIGDVGRSVVKNQIDQPSHTSLNVIAGQISYAPPELIYGHYNPDWNIRRLSCDLYLLGSLVMFYFANKMPTLSVALQFSLDAQHRSRRFDGGIFSGTFEEVLPYIEHAFSNVMSEVTKKIPADFRDEIVEIIMQLCNPNPAKRGHPRNRQGHQNPFGLERYVSTFNRLATKAEQKLRRK